VGKGSLAPSISYIQFWNRPSEREFGIAFGSVGERNVGAQLNSDGFQARPDMEDEITLIELTLPSQFHGESF